MGARAIKVSLFLSLYILGPNIALRAVSAYRTSTYLVSSRSGRTVHLIGYSVFDVIGLSAVVLEDTSAGGGGKENRGRDWYGCGGDGSIY